MKNKLYIVLLKCLFICVFMVAGSYLSSRLWNETEEAPESVKSMIFDADMTIGEFGERNSISDPILKEIFKLQSRVDLEKRMGELEENQQDILLKVNQLTALKEEHASKNWVKIAVKFGCWIVFLSIVLHMLRKSMITVRSRTIFYLLAVIIFGIILGSDPGPMGTIKDAIAMYGAKRAVFPPRMIALTIFLLMVVIANKFICSWGCQVGTIQDLLFRMNRNKKDKPLIKQYRIPFGVSNFCRIVFFVLFVTIAMVWSFDLVAPIDPFKLFKPIALGLTGSIFSGSMLLASIFIYRPWCHFFCPFGLVGWCLEKLAVFKIQVDYGTCISCEACVKICPSNVMDAILKRDRIIPDCFSCGSCIQVCPVHAISFRSGQRVRPPMGKFQKENEPSASDNIL